MMKKLIIIFFGAVLTITIFITIRSRTPSLTHKILPALSALPTPLPFEDLTIPYLRKKTYESHLNERTTFGNGANYTSYLTSYLSDGLKINGLLTTPTGTQPADGWPAIVFIHGYIPPQQYQTTGPQYQDYVDYFARNGFVVFKIDLRGHGDSEGQPGGAYYSADYVIDALNAYSALQQSDIVNPTQIGLWGHSMAGNVVMRSLAVKPEIPAAVIWAGAVYTYEDFTTYRIQDTSYVPPPSGAPSVGRRQRISAQMGQPDLSRPFWQQMAPSTYLKDLKGAIQINHAVNDDVVSIEYSRNLTRLLDKTAVPHELHEYPTGGHNISGISFVQAMDNSVQFFKKYLMK